MRPISNERPECLVFPSQDDVTTLIRFKVPFPVPFRDPLPGLFRVPFPGLFRVPFPVPGAAKVDDGFVATGTATTLFSPAQPTKGQLLPLMCSACFNKAADSCPSGGIRSSLADVVPFSTT